MEREGVTTSQNTAMLHENILDSMDNGVIALDFEGKIITFNAAAAKILAIPSGQALGRYYPEIFFGLEDNDEFNDVLINVIDTRETFMYREVTFVRDDGEAIPLGITSSLLKDERGEDYGVVSVFSDLREAKKRQFLQETLTRYVTRQVVDLILEHPEDIILDGEEREASVLFCDIRGFTTFSEKMAPKELVRMLREYFSLMVEAVFSQQGTVDKFIGDCVMAIFGAPTPQDDHAERAVCTALAMRDAVEIFNERRIQEGVEPIRIGVGINTGNVVVGNIGSEQRLEYTAIGDAVNLASRLEGINKQYGSSIMISESSANRLSDEIVLRELDEVRVKGKREPVKIYEVMGRRGELPAELEQVRTGFMQAMQLYKSRAWQQALQKFQQVLEELPADTAARVYVDRCLAYKDSPPPENWDGVFEMTTK
jgi:adenylate cyclase